MRFFLPLLFLLSSLTFQARAQYFNVDSASIAEANYTSLSLDSFSKLNLKSKIDTVKFQNIQKGNSLINNKNSSISTQDGTGVTHQTSVSMPIAAGDIGGELNVTSSGAATYSVQLKLPKGVQGCAPDLQLVYNSQAGNGMIGYGWDIGGISSITRLPSSQFHDGIIDPVDWDNSDRFALDGNRLILVSGVYGALNSEYTTESKSNTRVFIRPNANPSNYSGSYFEVWYPNGDKAFYGMDNASNGVTSHHISSIINKDNLIITFAYEKLNQRSYPIKIKYGSKNASDAPIVIDLTYEDTELVETEMINIGLIALRKILKQIKISSLGIPVKFYKFEHNEQSFRYMKLTKIREVNGQQNQELQPLSFTYNPDNYSIVTTATPILLENVMASNANVLTGDFNGNGIMDLIVYPTNKSKINPFYDAGSGTLNGPSYSEQISFQDIFAGTYLDSENKIESNQGIFFVQENTSLKQKYVKVTQLALGGTIEQYSKTWANPPLTIPAACNAYSQTMVPLRYISGDFNGDGLTDVIALTEPYSYASRCAPVQITRITRCDAYFLNIDRRTGSTIYGTSFMLSGVTLDAEAKINTGDFNGDGKTDFLVITNNMARVYGLNESNQLVELWWNNHSRIKPNLPILIGDYNGDGKTDFMQPFADNGPDNNWYAIHYATGVTFEMKESRYSFRCHRPRFNGNTTILTHLIPTDINNDGKTDLVYSETTTVNGSSTGQIHAEAYYNSGFTDPELSHEYIVGSAVWQLATLRNNPIPLMLNSQKPNPRQEIGFLSHNTINMVSFLRDVKGETALRGINQNGTQFTIDYETGKAPLWDENSNPNLPVYSGTSSHPYPYLNISQIPGISLVRKIKRQISGSTGILQQTFAYINAVSHVSGLGFQGFREIVKSNWHIDQNDPNRLFKIDCYDPFKRGALIQSFSSKIEKLSFSARNLDIDASTLSDYISRTDYTYDTQLQSNKIFKNVLLSTITKDNLSGTKNKKVFEYDSYLNTTKEITSFGTGESITTELTYANNPLSSDYYIGRPLTKKAIATNGSEQNVHEEEFIYLGNKLSQHKKRSNNSAFVSDNFEYDAFGNITKKTFTTTDGSREISMQHSASGRDLISSTDLQGLTTTYTYDPVTGNLLTETNQFGEVTTYEYDSWGRKIKTTDPLGRESSKSYSKQGNDVMLLAVDVDGIEQTTYINPQGNIKETLTFNHMMDQIGKKFEYDIYGRAVGESETSYSQNYQKWNYNTYDEYGRVSQTTDFKGLVKNIVYNGLSTTINDGVRSKTIIKNQLGQVVETQDPGGSIQYTYDVAGNLKSTNYGGSIQTISYDGWGRKTQLVDPSGGTYTYQYNAFGEIVQETNPKGIQTFNYDAATGRLNSRSFQGDETQMSWLYDYNATTKLLDVLTLTNSDGNNSIYTHTYDNFRRPKTVTEDNIHAWFKKTYTYNGEGQLFEEKFEARNKSNSFTSDRTIEHLYMFGTETEIRDQQTGSSLWSLLDIDANGKPIRITQNNHCITDYSYDTNGFISSSTLGIQSGRDYSEMLNLSYSWDGPRSNLISRSNSAFSWNETFSYDNLNRLTNFNDNNGNFSQSYSSNGTIQNNSQLGDYVYSNYQQTELNNITPEANTWYINRALQEISYNGFKQPVLINEPGKEKISFRYNGELQRSHMYYGDTISSEENRRYRRHYSQDGSTEITYDTQTGTTSFVFYLGGDAYNAPVILKDIHTTTTSEKKFYSLHRDHLGSIIMIMDDAGNIAEKRHFDAWGNIVKLTDGLGNTLESFIVLDRGYTGHEHLIGVGLINMNGRLYDPKLHRFLSPDNFIQDDQNSQNYNRYAYVLNNPLSHVDPSGEIAWFIPAIIIVAKLAATGAGIAAAGYTVSIAISDGGFRNWNWGQFGKTVGFGAISGVVSAGIGGAIAHGFKSITMEVIRAGAHGFANGVISELSGGKFIHGFASGAVGSGLGSAARGIGGFAKTPLGTMGIAAIGGGIGAEISGGEFWKGAVVGATVAALNHLANPDGDDKKRTNGKGNTFRPGKQKERDGDLGKYPPEFRGWYHKNAKDYKLPGQPDPDLGEPYEDWVELGKPKTYVSPNWNYQSLRSHLQTLTGLSGGALTLYIIISEGSRIFPARNLIPIP